VQFGIGINEVIMADHLHWLVASICSHHGNSRKAVIQNNVVVNEENFTGIIELPYRIMNGQNFGAI